MILLDLMVMAGRAERIVRVSYLGPAAVSITIIHRLRLILQRSFRQRSSLPRWRRGNWSVYQRSLTSVLMNKWWRILYRL